MTSKKVRTPSKTPRTLIGEFIDSNLTHTQEVLRDRFPGFVRTPEIPTARKAPKHDRVASLRGKKMSSSFTFGTEETPRQILEGFLADEHSTAPLVRVQKRTSQTGMSASQPTLPVTQRWSHVTSPANLTAELERDTPRTLIQKYLMNTTSTAETPVVGGGRKGTSDSLKSTPVVPLVNDTYNTPSPFRESSGGSSDVMPGTSCRSKTPRSRKGRFNLSTQDLGSSLVIPATNPNDYVVPSQFLSSSSEDSDEEVIVATQPSRRAHFRRSFNLMVPEHVKDQLKQGRERTNEQEFEMDSTPGDSHYDDSDISDQVSHNGHQAGSQQSRQMRDDSDIYDDQVISNGFQAEPGQSRQMPDDNMEVELELGDMGDIHSVSSEEDGRRFSILPREGIYREYTLPLKGAGAEGNEGFENVSHVSGSSARSRLVIYTDSRQYAEQQSSAGRHEDGGSQIGIGSSDLGYSPDSGGSAQAKDPFRYGRFSDGHQNRLVAMGKGDAVTRRSEGNVREYVSMLSILKGNESMDKHTGERNMASSDQSISGSEPSLQTANRSSESLMLSERKDRSVIGCSSHAANREDWSISGRSSRAADREDRSMIGRSSHAADREDRFMIGRSSHAADREDQSMIGRSSHAADREDRSMIGRSSHAADRERLYLGMEVTHTSLRGHSERTFLGQEKMPESVHVSQSGVRSFHTPALEAEEESGVDENSPFSAVTPSPVVSSRGNSPANVTPSRSQRSEVSPARSYERSSNARSGSVASMSARSETSFRKPGKRTQLQSMSPAKTGDVNNTSHRSSVIDAANNASPRSSRSSTRGQRSTPSSAGSRSGTQAEKGTPKSSMSAAASNLRLRNLTPSTPGSVQQAPAERVSPRSLASAPASRLVSRNASPATPQASPVVARRKHGAVDQLPQQSIMFSPQIASTQNIATLARTSPQPSSSQPRVEQEDLSEEEVATPEQSSPSRPVNAAASVDKSQPSAKKKVVRKPREKSRYLIPVSTVKKQFSHYAGMRVSKEAIEEVMKISETYWDNLCADLEAYAKHAGRKRIIMADFELLFRRQGYVTDKISLNSLIRRYLPWEEVEKLIPVQRANNRIEPPL